MLAVECDSLTEALSIQPSALSHFRRARIVWAGRLARPGRAVALSAFQDDLRDGVLFGVRK
jgi:hypothetical protein